MDQPFVVENAWERGRLSRLVDRMTDKELTLTLYGEGWTIAVALAHLAFWDQRSLILIRKWKESRVEPSAVDTDTINDALLPFFLAIPPRMAANLAVSSAEAIDKELEKAPPELVAGIQRLGDEHRLYRSIHRKMHIDEIEALLQDKRANQW
jgi:hypothetical protein